MAGAAGKPDRDTVIEALVLVVSNSAAKDVITPESLRSVINVEFEDMLSEDHVFDLDMVWEILEEQPSFDAELVKAPLCVFKTFEPHLDMTIKMPEAMADMSAGRISIKASDVKIPAVEMKRVLRGDDSAEKKAPSQVAEVIDDQPADVGGSSSRLPNWVMPMALAIALGAFGFTGFTLFQTCSGPKADWKSVSLSALSELPVKNARRFGAQVEATLTDDTWLSQDEKTRKTQLEAALEKLRVDGIRVIALRDASGHVRATAQYSGRGDKIGFTFLPAR